MHAYRNEHVIKIAKLTATLMKSFIYAEFFCFKDIALAVVKENLSNCDESKRHIVLG